MRQAQNTSNGYSAPDGATAYAPTGQSSFGHAQAGSYGDSNAAAASSQRINGLRDALASIEQRIGGMTQGLSAPQPQAQQAHYQQPQLAPQFHAPPVPGLAAGLAAYGQAAQPPHAQQAPVQAMAPAYAPAPYFQGQPQNPLMNMPGHTAPAMAPQPQQETMQQQLNRLATQVGSANTAMPRPPAAPRQPDHQPQNQVERPAPPTVDLSEITREMETLRRELGSLKDEVAKPVSVKTSVAQDEIDRIASTIADFQRKDRIDPKQFDRLAGELDDLRSSMRQDLKETMRRTLDEQAQQEAETTRALSQKLDHIAHNVASVQKAALESNMDEDQIASRIDELARQMEQLALHTATHSASQESDTARQEDLARRIEDLAQQVASNTPDRVNDHVNDLSTHVDGLSNNLGGLSTHVDGLSNNLGGLSTHVGGLSGHVDDLSTRLDHLSQQIETTQSGGNVDIAERIEALRASMSALPETIPTERIEDRLGEVSAKIEQLTKAAEASASAQHHLLKKTTTQDNLSADDLAQIEARLDEIARAVVAVSNISREAQRQPMPEIDLSGMDRLEARLADLSRTVDTIASVAQAEPQRDPALDEISVRIEGLTDRLGSFEKYARAGDLGGANALLAAPDTGLIEEQLRVLTARVEEAAASNSTAAQMDNLEAQVAQIMVMLDQAPQVPEGPSVDLAPLEQRLAGIENHLQQAPDLTVTAAQEAARQAISMVGENSEQGQLVAALSDHLNQLQAMAASGNAGTDQLQETLQAVMVRLEAIENSVERGNEMRESVAHAEATYAPPAYAPSPYTSAPYAPADYAPAAHATELAMPTVTQLHDAPVADASHHEWQMAQQADQTFMAADTLMDVADTHQPVDAPSAFVAAPSVDPADHLDGVNETGPEEIFEDHQPLEPNGGTGKAQTFSDLSDSSIVTPDVRPNAIAAARRALQATATEMNGEPSGNTLGLSALSKAGAGASAEGGNALNNLKAKLSALASKSNSETLAGSDASTNGDDGSKANRLRKPIMIAAAAVLLALVAFQGSKMFGGSSNDPELTMLEMPASTNGTAPKAESPRTVTLGEYEAGQQDTAAGETVTATGQQAGTTSTFDGKETTTPTTARTGSPVSAQPAANQERAGQQIDGGSATRTAAVINEAVTPPAPALAAATPTNTTYSVPEMAGPVALVTAAQAGEPKALFEVGMRYSNGRGLTRDLKEAGKWFQASAERGFAPAQYSYGSLLEKGIGVKKDLAAASQWYERAAAQGNARAMHNLAVLNASENPQTGQPDMERAINWFKQAADYGIKDSQFNLGILYGQGMGVPQNLEEAYKWFAIVARSGDTEAAAKRDQVAEAMDTATLNKVRAVVSDWQPKAINEAANRVTIPDEWKGRPGASTTDMVRSAQAMLNQRGFKVGQPDGLIGPKTTRAIKEFQKSSGLPVTGRVDTKLLNALKV